MSMMEMIVGGQVASRVRRNHGLEHATLHVLAEHLPRVNLAGHSDPNGFWIVGDVSTEDVIDAAAEALRRLKEGEHELAVHPNCGTNFVASGFIAGVAAWLGMLGGGRGMRSKLERLPMIISLTTVALFVAHPVGLILQARVTTSGEPGALKISEVIATRRGRYPAHRILTNG